eukprot:9155914-Alexandrium_andersonii.AAC.1
MGAAQSCAMTRSSAAAVALTRLVRNGCSGVQGGGVRRSRRATTTPISWSLSRRHCMRPPSWATASALCTTLVPHDRTA